MGKFIVNSNYHYSPYKFLIYGPEGIGKTMLASMFPDPIFIDTEGSTRYYDVRRISQPNGQIVPSSWQMFMDMIDAVKYGEIPCKTLVIDSLDWAEALCATAVCDKAGKHGIEDFGYAKGYTYLEEEFGRGLNRLNEVYDKGINICCTAHAAMCRIELPEETGAYDHWSLKLEKKTAALVKEWADVVLFCTYKTIVIKGNNPMEKNKAAGGKRVMYSTHTPWWDAKNRFNLPEEMPLDFKSIEHLFLYEQPQTAPQATQMADPAPKPDTAGEQLSMWAERAGVDIIMGQDGSDPGAVVFDAINAAKSRGTDILICDTAGRLHNKKNLMNELVKINRIIEREYPEAYKEVLVVLDGTTGQNALSQARQFQEATDISGIILTKLDGTAKGGIAVAIHAELGIPVKYIGVGEQIDDLQKFDADAFVNALFAQDEPS